ncbi:DUF4160 domain-containing protein [Stenotrophomonas lacuserhaii]
MPVITRLGRCTITMYAGDHPPPHFHVRTRDGREALIVIAGLGVLSGGLTRRELIETLRWAQVNIPLLTFRWRELNP